MMSSMLAAVKEAFIGIESFPTKFSMKYTVYDVTDAWARDWKQLFLPGTTSGLWLCSLMINEQSIYMKDSESQGEKNKE